MRMTLSVFIRRLQFAIWYFMFHPISHILDQIMDPCITPSYFVLNTCIQLVLFVLGIVHKPVIFLHLIQRRTNIVYSNGTQTLCAFFSLHFNHFVFTRTISNACKPNCWMTIFRITSSYFMSSRSVSRFLWAYWGSAILRSDFSWTQNVHTPAAPAARSGPHQQNIQWHLKSKYSVVLFDPNGDRTCTWYKYESERYARC